MNPEKTFIGAACAHVPQPNGAKTKYPRIGSVFQDSEGRISIKIDSIPIASSDWSGWINVFPPKDDEPF